MRSDEGMIVPVDEVEEAEELSSSMARSVLNASISSLVGSTSAGENPRDEMPCCDFAIDRCSSLMSSCVTLTLERRAVSMRL